MEQAIKFLNWTDEDFVHSWGGVRYQFRAGEMIFLPTYLAKHFAKHLTDREMNKIDRKKHEAECGVEQLCKKNAVGHLPTNHFTRPDYEAKCYPEGAPVAAPTEATLEVATMNANEPQVFEPKVAAQPEVTKKAAKVWCGSCDSKGFRHKQGCTKSSPKTTEKAKEEEFEGLDETPKVS